MTAGSERETPSSIDSVGAAVRRSAALSASQLRSTSPDVAAGSSPNTCGCRRTIFSETRCDHVVDREARSLGGDLRVEHDLQQQVAQLARQLASSPSSIASSTS